MRFQRIAVLAALVCLPFAFPSRSAGDIVFQIDLDRNQAGLQQMLSVTAGQTLNAAVILTVNDLGTETSLGGYEFSVAMDKSVFSFTDPTVVTNDAPRFNDPQLLDWFSAAIPSTVDDAGFSGVPYANYLGVEKLAALSLPPTRTTDFTYQVATLDILALNTGNVSAAVGDDVGNILVGAFSPSDGFVSGTNATIPASMIRFNNRIVAVPEPSAYALAGLCVAGLGYRQRRRSKAERTKENSLLA